jgi:hypothetical protein
MRRLKHRAGLAAFREMAGHALESKGAEMRWMQLARNPKQLLEHFRRLIADFGVTEELATRIHKLHGLLTAAAKASADDSSDLTGSTALRALSLKVFFNSEPNNQLFQLGLKPPCLCC